MTKDLVLPTLLDQVRVRYFDPKDVDGNIALYMSDATMRYVGGVRLTTAERRSRLSNVRHSINMLTIADAADDSVIGACGVLLREGEVYILLREEHCGRGIARVVVPALVQLARQEGLRPYGCVHPDNKASLTLLERLGWNRVGQCEAKSEWQRGHLRLEPPPTL